MLPNMMKYDITTSKQSNILCIALYFYHHVQISWGLPCTQPGVWVFMLKSMLISKDFQTWRLIGWQHSRQPIRSIVRKSLLTYMGFNVLTWILLSNPSPGVPTHFNASEVVRISVSKIDR